MSDSYTLGGIQWPDDEPDDQCAECGTPGPTNSLDECPRCAEANNLRHGDPFDHNRALDGLEQE